MAEVVLTALLCKLKPVWLGFDSICLRGEWKLFLCANFCWTSVKGLCFVVWTEEMKIADTLMLLTEILLQAFLGLGSFVRYLLITGWVCCSCPVC